MYLDFDDHHPDTPHLPPAFSRLERLLLTIVAYLVLVIVYLVTPASWLVPAEATPVAQVPPKDPVTFVMMEPLRERPAPPKVQAEASDLDRQSATRERAPVPENPAPFSRGNTPDKVEGAPPVEPPRGANGVGESTPPPETAIIPSVTPPPANLGEGLANSLRNLQRSLRNENFSNENGGQTQQDAQISFDSKGVDFGWWLRRFVAQVKGNWYIPQAAMVLKGRVVITLFIHRNGTISDVTVVQSSGVQSLDTAAVNALKSSNPTVALPAEYPESKVLFTVTFLYNTR
jgi:TonB family protein